MTKQTERNHMLDAMKAVAAIGIILVHFPLPGVLGRVCSAVGATGVILFFLISGYQSYGEDAGQSDRILRRFRRNLVVTATVIAVYFLFTVAEQAALGSLGLWAKTYLADPVTYIRMVTLGDFACIHGDHIWYLVAMLYAYLILYCMEKYRLHRIFYRLLPLLLLLRITMETVTNSPHNIPWLDWHYSGNALVGALPIMLLGNFLGSKKEDLLKGRTAWYLAGMGICLLLTFGTVNTRIFGLDLSQPFKIAAGVFAFLVCLKLPRTRPVPLLASVGGDWSLYIYLYHFLLGTALKNLLEAVGAALWIMDWILPVLAIGTSLLTASLMVKLGNRKSRHC